MTKLSEILGYGLIINAFILVIEIFFVMWMDYLKIYLPEWSGAVFLTTFSLLPVFSFSLILITIKQHEK